MRLRYKMRSEADTSTWKVLRIVTRQEEAIDRPRLLFHEVTGVNAENNHGATIRNHSTVCTSEAFPLSRS